MPTFTQNPNGTLTDRMTLSELPSQDDMMELRGFEDSPEKERAQRAARQQQQKQDQQLMQQQRDRARKEAEAAAKKEPQVQQQGQHLPSVK